MIPLWLTGCQHPYACVLSCFSRFRPLATLWTVSLQAALSMGFCWQEYWSALPCPPPGNLPDPGIETVSLKSLALAGSTTYEAHQRLQIHLYSNTLTFPFFYSLNLYLDPYYMVLNFRLLPSWSVLPTMATIIFSKCILFPCSKHSVFLHYLKNIILVAFKSNHWMKWSQVTIYPYCSIVYFIF